MYRRSKCSISIKLKCPMSRRAWLLQYQLDFETPATRASSAQRGDSHPAPHYFARSGNLLHTAITCFTKLYPQQAMKESPVRTTAQVTVVHAQTALEPAEWA